MLALGMPVVKSERALRVFDDTAGHGAAVYLYFESKQELIAAGVELTLSMADELFQVLLVGESAPSPEETVSFMLDAVMQWAVDHPLLVVDMSRVVLHAWAEGLRDPEIAERVEHWLRRLRQHYAEVAQRWQGAGLPGADADPLNVGAVLLGVVRAFALQRLLILGTEPAAYLAGLRGLLAAAASER
jgi:AcrR family transcriptional regulator